MCRMSSSNGLPELGAFTTLPDATDSAASAATSTEDACDGFHTSYNKICKSLFVSTWTDFDEV